MPLFSAKFSVKKVQARKNQSISRYYKEFNASQIRDEFEVEYQPISLRLNGTTYQFDEDTGNWQSKVDAGSLQIKTDDLTQSIREQNNLLKLKNEVLIELLSQRVEQFYSKV